ncbi:MAG: hypothetical protein GXP13_04880 [Gammaproteobacteria bacterium]|nr:hypothetical protein [Gammaproteobacteria bacterium]
MKARLVKKLPIHLRPVKLLLYGLIIAIFTGCGGAGDGQAPDPVVVELPIAYVKRPVPLDNNNMPVQADAREALTINAGADLWIRDRATSSAIPRNITSVQTEGMGDVKDVETSFDGTMLIFSMREPDRATDLQIPTWNIWIYDIASSQLKRIISDNITAEQGEDLAPHFLPNGKIIFTSTRQKASKVILTDEGPVNNNNKTAYTSLDENRNELALVLHVLNVDCTSFDTCQVTDSSDISQISFNQSHDLDPTVLSSGKILFTRWDNAGARNAMHLYKANPDGTEMKLVYGRQSHNSGTAGSTVQFMQPREMEDGRVLSILRPYTGTLGGGDIIAIDVSNYADDTRPILPNQLTPITNGQSSLIDNGVLTTNAASPGGRYSAAYPLWDGSNRMLVSWTPCRMISTDVNITTIFSCTAARLADTVNFQEAPPLYGLFVFDPANKTQNPVFQPEENVLYTDIVVAQTRTRPTVIATKIPGIDPELNLDLANNGTGILHIRSVYDVDGIFNGLTMDAAVRSNLNTLAAADANGFAGLFNFSLDNRRIAYLADPGLFTSDNRPARFLRITKAVGIPDQLNGADFNIDNDAFGRSTQQGMREIIGYAPIEPDGSVMVEVPANVPLAISVLDNLGRRISVRHQSWIQVNLGETVTCNGCHAANPSTVNPADGIHGHETEQVGVNFGAPQDGYLFPGSNTVPLIVADTINGQTTGETMAQARYGDNCTDNSCKASFDINFIDIWTNAIEAPFGYEYRNLRTDEVIPLTVGINSCYNATASTNNWNATCRTIINYPEIIQPVWDAVRSDTLVCDPTLIINDPRCDQYINPATPPAVPFVFPLTTVEDGTCTTCHTQANQRLDLSNTADGNFVLSYTQLFTTQTVQAPPRDASCNLLTVDIQVPLNPPDPLDPTATMTITVPAPLQPVNIPAQMSINGARQSVFFDRFVTDVTCQTVDHKLMLSDDEKKLLYEWLDPGAQYYNDPTNINVPTN